MIAYRSWAGIVVIFLCAAAGSHIIADHITAHVSQKSCIEPVRDASLPKRTAWDEYRQAKMLKVTYGPGQLSISPSDMRLHASIGNAPKNLLPVQTNSEQKKTKPEFYAVSKDTHLVAANAASREPEAYFACERAMRLQKTKICRGRQS